MKKQPLDLFIEEEMSPKQRGRKWNFDRDEAKPSNSIGMDPRLFNLIFALITGRAALVGKSLSGHLNGSADFTTHLNLKGLDVWKNTRAIRLFRFFLFGDRHARLPLMLSKDDLVKIGGYSHGTPTPKRDRGA